MKKRSRKEYIVIGLGRFGTSIAKQLEANGCMVLAIDNNEQKIRQIAEYVTLAMCLDVSNEEALEEIGGRNFDSTAPLSPSGTVWTPRCLPPSGPRSRASARLSPRLTMKCRERSSPR